VHCHFGWHLSANLFDEFATDITTIPCLRIPPATEDITHRQCAIIRDQFGSGETVMGTG
jgi:hypothetical protein